MATITGTEDIIREIVYHSTSLTKFSAKHGLSYHIVHALLHARTKYNQNNKEHEDIGKAICKVVGIAPDKLPKLLTSL